MEIHYSFFFLKKNNNDIYIYLWRNQKSIYGYQKKNVPKKQFINIQKLNYRYPINYGNPKIFIFGYP